MKSWRVRWGHGIILIRLKQLIVLLWELCVGGITENCSVINKTYLFVYIWEIKVYHEKDLVFSDWVGIYE